MKPSQRSAHLDELTTAVVDRLPAILADVRDLLSEQHPGYAAFLAGDFPEVVVASRHFVARLLGSREPEPSLVGVERALFEEIGRECRRGGQPVGSLLSAYRSGASVVWQHLSELAVSAGFSANAVAAAAARVIVAVDQLSAASLDGYLEEQAPVQADREEARRDMHTMLLAGRATTAASSAGRRAGWVIPATAAVVVVRSDAAGARRLGRLPECLIGVHGSQLVGILPDPDGPGRRSRLRAELAGAGAVVGATGPVADLPMSFDLADLAARLQRSGVLPEDPLFVDEHLDALVVHRDPHVLRRLRERCLAPLDGEPPASRERLVETLECWLTHLGRPGDVASSLRVHPQTVRYRMRRLHELFGPDLDIPDRRAALTLALAWGPPADPATSTPNHLG